jgi:glucans biosynthesis protein
MTKQRWIHDRRVFLAQLGSAILAACSPRSAPRDPSTNAGDRAADGAVAKRALEVFEDAARRAAIRASNPVVFPNNTLPKVFQDLPYDVYRKIRFRAERGLFHGEGRRFEAQLFHRGFTQVGQVAIYLHDTQGSRQLPFEPDRFTYPEEVDQKELAGLGYAGLRLHAPINRADYFDEVVVFLGASYFRAVSKGLHYGLSARCLALDSGLPRPEEFPEITALHLITPEPGQEAMHVIADVASKRLEAAFHLIVTPGDITRVDVTSAVFTREDLSDLGLAPLTSMFFFGEDGPKSFDDFRGEVHDSDGLILLARNGERIFRPLRNPPRTTLSSFRLDSPVAFGLVQRDRSLASYQDLEARYDRRPSAWVEPQGDWAEGSVRLLEIASSLETDDNIGAFFVPGKPTRSLRYSYRLSFGDEPPFAMSGGQVRAFRSGVPATGQKERATDGSRLFVVDFVGKELAKLDAVEAHVDVTQGAVSEVRTEKHPVDGSFRLVCRVTPTADDVELRAFLHRGKQTLSETLAYLWQPQK